MAITCTEGEVKISEFGSVRSKQSQTISLQEYVNKVRSNTFKAQVEEYRRLAALPGHEAEAQRVKDGDALHRTRRSVQRRTRSEEPRQAQRTAPDRHGPHPAAHHRSVQAALRTALRDSGAQEFLAERRTGVCTRGSRRCDAEL